jgi:hypothetical protein
MFVRGPRQKPMLPMPKTASAPVIQNNQNCFKCVISYSHALLMRRLHLSFDPTLLTNITFIKVASLGERW